MTIPNKYWDVPVREATTATMSELQAVGFYPGMPDENTPGLMPEQEIALESGVQSVAMPVMEAIMARSIFRVLRNEEDEIVANWDEGRWWTPEESAMFVEQILVDFSKGEQTPRGGH